MLHLRDDVGTVDARTGIDAEVYRGFVVKMPEALAGSGPPTGKLDIGGPVSHGVLDSCLIAWSHHCPLALSPTTLWLTLCQSVGAAIKKHDALFQKVILTPQALAAAPAQAGGVTRLSLQVVRSPEDMALGRAGDPHFWATQLLLFDSMQAEAVMPEVLDLLKGRFSDMTTADSMAMVISTLAVLQPFFSCDCVTMCALTALKLEGTVEDWEQLADRVGRLGTVLGPDFASMFRTNIDAVAGTVGKLLSVKRGEKEHLPWLQGIISHESGSGEDYITGWILDFVWFTGQGVLINHGQRVLQLDTNNFPLGYGMAPLSWDGVPNVYGMYAGCWSLTVTAAGALGTRAEWMVAPMKQEETRGAAVPSPVAPYQQVVVPPTDEDNPDPAGALLQRMRARAEAVRRTFPKAVFPA